MTNAAGRPRKAAPATKPEITPENAPEVPTDPAPQGETQEQKEIRELREIVKALQAQQAAAAVEDSGVHDDKEGDTVVIHFVEDGVTAQGQVWYTGQELEFVVGGDRWQDTLDRNGNSWVSQTEDEQIERRGKVYFRRGPWKGKGYKDAKWEKDGPPESELERADRLERERRRSVPRLPDLSDEK